jgi:recombination protein RecA
MMKDFVEDILERFGEKVLVEEGDVVDVISTGCMSMDVSIGVGGIPRGKITEIFGSEGSGKTTLAMSIVKECLLAGGNALYVDAENMLDYTLLRDMVGEVFDKERLVILNPETAEDAFNMVEMGVASGSFSLVILDSIGSLAPKKEKEDDFEDANVGLLARMVSKFLRRNSYIVSENNVALVLLNQVRDKVGSYMGGYETPGGHALKHFTSLRIALNKGESMKVGGETIGIQTKFVIRKNKMSAPFRSYTIPIIFGKGVDKYSDIIDFCTMLGVIKKKGSYYKYEDTSLGQGKIAAGSFIQEHPEIVESIEKTVYGVINKYTSIDISELEKQLEESEAKDES